MIGISLQSATIARRVRQLVRYGTVSLVSTAVSLSVLGTLVVTGALPAAWANVVATAIGTVPSFELNRRWVWGRTGRRSVVAEMGPFVAMTFAGLGLSTVAVAVADAWARSKGMDVRTTAIVVDLANIAGFGSLWLIQFVILDRVLFRDRRAATAIMGEPRELEPAA